MNLLFALLSWSMLSIRLLHALPQMQSNTTTAASLVLRATTDPDPMESMLAVWNNCDDTAPCNAPGCRGQNMALDAATGQCTAGPCMGVTCKSVCPATEPKCPSDGCKGTQYKGVWQCAMGEIKGCTCTPDCPSETKPECKECAGFNSWDGQADGQCGYAENWVVSGCPCKSNCLKTPPRCDNVQCKGFNQNADSQGMCEEGDFAGCPCDSTCPEKTIPCDTIGCNGFNVPETDGGGQCTEGRFAGCPCASICGQIQEQTCDSIPGCGAVKDSHGPGTCVAGKYLGCSCDSQCPLPLVSCTDMSCQGSALGICEVGTLIGCDCNSNT
jgi:hypothetical protein